MDDAILLPIQGLLHSIKHHRRWRALAESPVLGVEVPVHNAVAHALHQLHASIRQAAIRRSKDARPHANGALDGSVCSHELGAHLVEAEGGKVCVGVGVAGNVVALSIGSLQSSNARPLDPVADDKERGCHTATTQDVQQLIGAEGREGRGEGVTGCICTSALWHVHIGRAIIKGQCKVIAGQA